MSSATSKARFWLLYLAAWLPLFAANTAITLVEAQTPLLDALGRSLGFVAPAALLGIGVLEVSRRLPRAAARPLSYWAAQLGLSVVFAFLFAGGVMLWRWLDSWLRGTELTGGMAWFVWFLLSGLMIYGSLAGVGYGLQTAERLRREEARAARAEALRTEAELAALRAQLNPHFLFNTLHSLLTLVRHDPEHAEEALEQFGDLLRYTLSIQQDTVDEVALAEEWSFVENYLGLERLRLGERLKLETEIEPEALAWKVPVFSLQPLVENAIGHAVAPRAAGGTVKISARLEDGHLRLEVSDDGPGADPDDLDNGSGMGLRIVRQRLAALSHGRARFDVETRNGKGFAVRLHVPPDLGSPAAEPP